MSHVDLLDRTRRDGQQRLWGMRMQAGMALPVADLLDRTGFRVIDATGSSFMEVLVKYCREDPWEGLDLLREAIHRTPMRAGMRGNACVSFGVTPDALMDLWMRRLNEHGVRSFWIYDVLYGIDNFARLAGISILHTATRPMANGPSVPSTESVVRNLELMGHTHGLDTSLLLPVAEHFRRVGRTAGYLVDQVSEYDLFNVTHQVPGGMVGTLRAQLVQHDMADRIEEVLAEAGTVREELGWPVMAT